MKNMREKFKWGFNKILSIFLLFGIAFSVVTVVIASAPDPGHTWSEIGDVLVDLANQVTGTLGVGNGGTGATTLTANNVILGNDTSAVQFVAPGTSGNVLTSDGTTWNSTAPAGGAAKIAWSGASSASLTASSICLPNSYTVCGTTLTAATGVVVPMNVTIKNLYANNSVTAPGAGSTCKFIVRKSTTCAASSYSDTALTCTIVGNGSLKTCSDTSHTDTVSAGNCLQLEYIESGTCAGVVSWGFELDP